MEQRIQDLNRVYQPVYEQMKSILKELKAQGYICEWGFYNHHSIKQGDEWVLEYYPIPVITVKDVCDIGLDMNHTFIECKLKREVALAFDFSVFSQYKYQVYGIEDFLNDFYNDSLDFDGLTGRIKNSNEQEIGVSLFFGYAEQADIIINAVNNLKKLEL